MMKSDYEITWNLLGIFNRDCGGYIFGTTLNLDKISEITGVSREVVSDMDDKQALLKVISRMPKGIQLAKDIIEEITLEIPHYYKFVIEELKSSFNKRDDRHE